MIMRWPARPSPGICGVRTGRDHYAISFAIANLLEDAGDRFAPGDPFDVVDGPQIAPQPPRTIRLGADGRY